MGQNILLLLFVIDSQKKILDVKIKGKELVDKSDISNLVKNSDLKTKLATLATKA